MTSGGPGAAPGCMIVAFPHQLCLGRPNIEEAIKRQCLSHKVSRQVLGGSQSSQASMEDSRLVN